MVPSIGDGFSRPRLDASGLSGRFSSPKLEPPDPTNVIYKSNNSSKIKLRFEEIRQDLDHIWWDTVRFEEIQADFSKISTILGEIRWHSRRSKLISGEIQGDPSWFLRDLDHIWWDPARFKEIQAYFGDFRSKCTEFLKILATLLKIPVTFAESDNSLNWPNTTQTRNRLDRLTPTIGFGSLFHPPDAVGLGRKSTRPDSWTALI